MEAAGIRALALKGSVLARALYDDVAWRSAGDIDILVAAGDLAGAIEVVEAMDWRWQRSPDRSDRLPVPTRPSRIPRCREWSCTGACTGTRIASPQTRSNPRSVRWPARRCECCPRTGLRRSRSSTPETAFPGFGLRRTSRLGGIRGAPARTSMR
ncbi:MAG: nucleotidyltransferase family protein [Solirubrobacteraceae bacterium]